MDNPQVLFFEMLQVATGSRCRLSRKASAEEWRKLYDMCIKQSVAGIGFVAMQRLPEEQWPKRGISLPWAAVAQKIRQRNVLANHECVKVCRILNNDGFDCCILKGQSNLSYYPEWLHGFRTPGDIDILMRRKGVKRGRIRTCVDYCLEQARKSNVKPPRIYYHHADLPWHGRTEVEAHYRASWLNSPIRNFRLQRWLADDKQWCMRGLKTGDGMMAVPSTAFDAVYQLLHIYKHLFDSGIGLRQVLDYYFVLQTLKKESDDKHGMQDEVMGVLRRLGMQRFAAAMMWVMEKAFDGGGCLNKDGGDCSEDHACRQPWMLCMPDEKEGRFLLDEIMLAGNFGKYDTRLAHRMSVLGRTAEKMKRSMWFITHYPEEVVCKPLFMAYHWIWRVMKLWKMQ